MNRKRYRWNRSKCAENLRVLGYVALAVVIPAEIWLLFMAAAALQGGVL